MRVQTIVNISEEKESFVDSASLIFLITLSQQNKENLKLPITLYSSILYSWNLQLQFF